MSFADDMNRIAVRLKFKTQATFVGTVAAMHASIKGDESGGPNPITGAPGQPVDTGELKGSWISDIGPTQATISTNVEYALPIEMGVGPFGPLTLRSKLGGFHSVKMTIAGASALQADVVRRLA